MEGRRTKRQRTLYVEQSQSEDADPQEEAACGTIKSVTLKNFMCHNHLHAEFNSQINLLQGRNGSGKSAILTAVVVGLGGSTRLTNRGKSLKDLIKYDKHTANIQIVLTNEGKDAYKHDVFGDTIIVERKIVSTGAATYQIKKENGTVVSSKKDDLKRICDHFSLSVENPLTVLNQDMSRSFLSSTDPKNLYKFFFEVTQLQMMSDSYINLTDSLVVSNDIIRERKACLPFVEKQVNDAQRRYEFCLKFMEKKKMLGELRREIVWAKIIQLEKDSVNAEKVVLALQKETTKYEEKLAEVTTKTERTQNEYVEQNQKFKSICREMTNLKDSYKSKAEAVTRIQENFRVAKRQVDRAKRQVLKLNNEVTALNEAIKKDHTAAQQVWEEQQAQHQNRLREIEAQVMEASQIIKTEETHIANLQNTLMIKQEGLMQFKFEETAKNRNLQELQQELKTLQSQKTNRFTVFGQWVQPLLDRIETAFRQKKFNRKPVGPIGAYIEVLDSQWSHIAEKVIGTNIKAFCVHNKQDEMVLRSLFRSIRFGEFEPPVIITTFRPRPDPRMIANNEVQSPDYKSMWSVLKIDDDVVAGCLLDLLRMETMLLIPTAQEASQLLKDKKTVPRNCQLAYTLRGDRYYPDPSYRVYSGQGIQRTRYLQISVEEKAQAVKSDINRINDELNLLLEEKRSSEEECFQLKAQERDSNQKLHKERLNAKHLRTQLAQLQSQEEPPPPNVSQLEEDIRKQEANLSAAEEALSSAEEQERSIENQYKEASALLEEEGGKKSLLKNEAVEIEEAMKEVSERASTLKRSENVVKQKIDSIMKKVKEAELRKKEVEDLLQKENEIAKRFLPRKETDKSFEELSRKYKHLEERLKNEKQDQGGGDVEIAENYKNLRESLLKMQSELEAQTTLVKNLSESLEDRQSQFGMFRKLISIIVKSNFKQCLNIRNLVGKASFNFEKETLTLNVEKRSSGSEHDPVSFSSRGNKQGSQQQILSMMSGGERSFATVAFILALWEVMDSPVRILDEFDVFMDIVARRQSLHMMIDAAKPKTQYIYLTPLEVNKSQYSTKLNIFRMPDPERNSTT